MTADAETLPKGWVVTRREDLGIDETLGNLGKVLAFLKALQGRLGKFVNDPGGKPEYFLSPVMVETVERLAYLAGMSALEREFVNACASDKILDAFDGRLAYADWLEERGDEAGALRLRKVSPRPGDVLVIKMSAGTPGLDPLEEARGLMGQAAHVQQVLAARGVETSWVVLRPTASLSRVPEQDMAELGWVPAARVAEEREACARVAEGQGCERTPALIRARGDTPA